MNFARSTNWQLGPKLPAASVNEIHLWRMPLRISAAQRATYWQTLNGAERLRAERYLLEKIRRRFIACRGGLRAILSRYLQVPAADIEFQYANLGKPSLSPALNKVKLQFNVSDSYEMAVCAVTTAGELGVDIERSRPMENLEALAERYFAKEEIRSLGCLFSHLRLQGFYNCWTRKEAMLKAIGTGLTTPLDQVVVTLMPHEPTRLISIAGSPEEAEKWQLASFEPVPGYTGAVAMIAEHLPRLRFFDWL